MTFKGIKKNINNLTDNSVSKARNSKLSEESKLTISGIADNALTEPIPIFPLRKGDQEIKGYNNTSIVLGRDRTSGIGSGYGGLGDTQAGAIDIVVGRMGDDPIDNVVADVDFFKDSARIYISQKTDIDTNFNIAKGNVGESIGFSGIAIKADAVRLISRHGMKLVTGTDEKNSKGDDVATKSGIDIIANNDDTDLQPIVKGDNLRDLLTTMTDEIVNLSGIISTFLTSQMKFNAATSTHYHYSPFYGLPTTPSVNLITSGVETSMKQLTDCIIGLQRWNFNVVSYKTKYLVPGIIDPQTNKTRYINSSFNKVN